MSVSCLVRSLYVSTLRPVTTLGRNIARLRRLAGMTQEDLAQAAGIRQSQVGDLEVDRNKDARVLTVLRIAAGLNVLPEALLEGLGGTRTGRDQDRHRHAVEPDHAAAETRLLALTDECHRLRAALASVRDLCVEAGRVTAAALDESETAASRGAAPARRAVRRKHDRQAS